MARGSATEEYGGQGASLGEGLSEEVTLQVTPLGRMRINWGKGGAWDSRRGNGTGKATSSQELHVCASTGLPQPHQPLSTDFQSQTYSFFFSLTVSLLEPFECKPGPALSRPGQSSVLVASHLPLPLVSWIPYLPLMWFTPLL